MVLGIGFLLLVSLVVSAALTAALQFLGAGGESVLVYPSGERACFSCDSFILLNGDFVRRQAVRTCAGLHDPLGLLLYSVRLGERNTYCDVVGIAEGNGHEATRGCPAEPSRG